MEVGREPASEVTSEREAQTFVTYNAMHGKTCHAWH